MNILHVIPSISPRCGGTTYAICGLTTHLAKKGHNVRIFTTNLDGVGRAIAGTMDVPLNRPILKNRVEIRYFATQYPRWVFSWDFMKALRAELKKTDIVHIHSLYLFTTSITAQYCRYYNVPYLIRPHGSLDPFLRRKRNRLVKAIYHKIIECHNWDNAAAIHYTSQEEMKLAHRPLRIKAPAIVVPNGLDLEEYSDLPPYGRFREKYPVLKGKKVLLFLSRINFKKGLDILARAFGEVARKRGDVYLAIVGPDDEGYGEKVKKWLAEEGVLDRTIFTGMLLGKDKLSAFRDSDIFVLPSYTENFGIVVIEALACNLPVVISNRVNVWREIAEADAGVVINCDPKELARALLELLDDSERCRKLGENGRRLVEQKFTWEKVTDQMIKVYEDILNGRLKAGVKVITSGVQRLALRSF